MSSNAESCHRDTPDDDELLSSGQVSPICKLHFSCGHLLFDLKSVTRRWRTPIHTRGSREFVRQFQQ
jgi:hypothetical protein